MITVFYVTNVANQSLKIPFKVACGVLVKVGYDTVVVGVIVVVVTGVDRVVVF